MLAAAAATGRSTHLYWLPCRGSMLRGIIQGYGHGKFSDECSGQMDADNASVMPWTSDLNLVAMALLGVAWLTRFVHVFIEHMIMIGFRFSMWNPPSRLWIPHMRDYQHLRHLDRDHDPTHATGECRR